MEMRQTKIDALFFLSPSYDDNQQIWYDGPTYTNIWVSDF